MSQSDIGIRTADSQPYDVDSGNLQIPVHYSIQLYSLRILSVIPREQINVLSEFLFYTS